jgi:hypothetical protein
MFTSTIVEVNMCDSREEPLFMRFSEGLRMGERVRRIELPYAAWEAAVLPLNYTRGQEVVLI